MTRSGCSNAPTMYALPLMLTCSGPRWNLDVHVRQGLDFFESESVCDLVDHEVAILAAQNRQVRHHHVDAIDTRQRILAASHQFRSVLAVAVLHHDDQLLLAGDQVHSAADSAQPRVAEAEVRQV